MASAPSRRRGRLISRRLGGLALRLSGIALLIAIWWLISAFSNPVRVPSPGVVFDTLIRDLHTVPALEYVAYQTGGIWAALTYTFVNVLIGVGVGAALGFVLGAILGRVALLRDLFSVPLLLLGTVPILVLLPFLVIWFGTARIVQSGLVIAFALITVTTVTQQATEDISGRYCNYAMCMGASRWRVLREVVLPGIVPPAIGAVRVAAATGWSFATVAELLGGQQGTGKLIQAMQGLSATADILAVIIALGIAALVLDALIALAGAWVVRWQE
jgi:ABC-type nitrate/sulfonate/bicarbonate transport system permease component